MIGWLETLDIMLFFFITTWHGVSSMYQFRLYLKLFFSLSHLLRYWLSEACFLVCGLGLLFFFLPLFFLFSFLLLLYFLLFIVKLTVKLKLAFPRADRLKFLNYVHLLIRSDLGSIFKHFGCHHLQAVHKYHISYPFCYVEKFYSPPALILGMYVC